MFGVFFVKPQRVDVPVLGKGEESKSAGTSTPPLENPVLSVPGFSHPHKLQEQSWHS